MFGQDKNQIQVSKKTDKIKDYTPPIHTMKKDVKGIKVEEKTLTPEKPAFQSESSSFSSATKTTGGSFTGESPFLDQEDKKSIPATAKIEKESLLTNKNELHFEENSKRGLGKAVVAAVIIFIILLLGAGGYYFWITRMNNSSQQSDEIETFTPELVAIPSQPETSPDFSTDKPNYLSLDIQDGNTQPLKNILENYSHKITKSNQGLPVEFIPTDAQNNPLDFSKFAQTFGINLPQDILSTLEPGFSLFIYDNGMPRTGLGVSVKDSSRLQTLLLTEEINLPQELQPLFLADSFTFNNNPFKNSLYREIPIRYSNIISPEELSIDYTIYKDYLLIGTTKDTLRAMIDYVDKQTNPTTPNGASAEQPIEGFGEQTVDNL